MQSLQMRCPVAAQSGLSTATIASAPMLLPRALTMFISEIFSSSGQPSRVTPNTLLRKLPSFSRRPERAAVLLLVVAPDAVIRLVERAGEVGAGVGQREPVARPPVVLGQTQHRDAVPHRSFRPARGGACRAGAARGTAGRAVPGASGRGQRRPGGILERGAQRQRVRGLVIEPARHGISRSAAPRRPSRRASQNRPRVRRSARQARRRAWDRSAAPHRLP